MRPAPTETGPLLKHPQAVAGELRVTVLSTCSAVERIADDWRMLVERQAGPAHALLGPDWVLSVLRRQEGCGRTAIRTALVQDDRGPVLIAPLSINSRRGVRVLQWLGEPLPTYGDVIAREGSDVAGMMRAVVAKLRASGDPIDVVHLRKVRADAAVMPFLGDFRRVPQSACLAPYVDFSAFDRFEDYLATRNSSVLKGYRRKRRRLEELGELSFGMHGPGEEAQALGRHAIEMKVRWMDHYGKVSRAFAGPSRIEPLIDLLGEPRSGACVFALYLDARPLALEVGLVSKDRYYSILGAMDLDYYKFSPGNLQLLDTLRWCFEAGITTYDFLPSDTDYKRSWSTDAAAEDEWVRSFSTTGVLYENIVLKAVLPISKRLHSRAPLALRKAFRTQVLRVLSS